MRYLLFAGPFYYAHGGAHDFIEGSDSIDPLIIRAEKLRRQSHDHEWWHILDCAKGKIVIGSKEQAHGPETLPDDLAYETPH